MNLVYLRKLVFKIGLILFLFLLGQPLSAKSAGAFFYSCKATKGFVAEDKCLSVTYTFDITGYTDVWNYCPCPNLKVKIKNKTQKIIYLDLEKSFFVRGDEAEPFYVQSSTSTESGKAGGLLVNTGSIAGALGVAGAVGTILNGVNIGSGSSSTTTTTYSQRIIAIPPSSAVVLKTMSLFIPGNETFSKNGISCTQENKGLYITAGHKEIEEGKSIEYNEEKSPFKFSTFIGYTVDNESTTLLTFQNKIYVKKITGIKYSALSGNINWDYLEETIPNWKKLNSFWLRSSL